MADTPRRTYAGETATERAVRRRDALVDAAITLVGEQGWAALRVEKVCAAAGLNNRYYYECFGSLDALSVAMVDRLTDEILELVVVEDLSGPASDLIEVMVATLVDHAVTSPARVQVLFDDLGTNAAAAQRRSEAVRRIIDVLVLDGRTVHQTTDPIVEVTASVLVNGSIRTMLDWLDGRLELTRDQFVQHLTHIWTTTTQAVLSDPSALGVEAR
ncbi:TetR/AcrR family transcriptional regulator [Gordonia sp. ABSL1-1]|uniref:TetR/AcrR family transcriptional regulator n=1 Tax=Gordonia sp. ABSL1-1 TaxID=3053923 RepID=UPI002572AF9E|nr:TetR/AcrR family transcriptional regulator [Gordonia sp. ABSL1-1]MDL9937684.1 TetR/AcrR family transcriptional regulator [Gordonia sp. ABSL1-1]